MAHPIGRILSPQDRGVRLLTRNGKDWTGRFPTIVDAAAELKARSCLIDGEVVGCDSQYRDSKVGYAVSVTLIILVIGVERLGGDPNQRAMPAISSASSRLFPAIRIAASS